MYAILGHTIAILYSFCFVGRDYNKSCSTLSMPIWIEQLRQKRGELTEGHSTAVTNCK